jgi:hypothetical protein
MLNKKSYLGLILFFSVFVTSTFFIHSAFAAVSEGCGLWDVNPECDLSGWMKLFLGDVAIGAVLAILLHFFAHRSNVKIEKNSEQLKENSETIKENSITIQKILDTQENSRNRRRDYFVQSTNSSFNAVLLRLGLMNRIVLNEKNIDTDDQYHRLELEEIAIHEVIEKVKHAISLAVDILDPMLVTQIDNLFTYIEQLTPSKNKEKLEFSEYEETKEKIMHLRDRMEEFVTTKAVLK